MTTVHEIMFWFWKNYQALKGFKIGTIVKIHSQEKGKYIKGCISSISGDSISEEDYDFYFGINLFEPIQGFNSQEYNWGSYKPTDFKLNPVDKIFYNNIK